MQNLIVVCAGMFIIGALIMASNMSRVEKLQLVSLLIFINIGIGAFVTLDAIWLIPCMCIGMYAGHLSNVSIDKKISQCK